MSFLGQKNFEAIDQKTFAEASGDWNPIHLDPLVARRTQMGVPLVHGMHTVLACLDLFAQSINDSSVLTEMSVSFLKPVYMGDRVDFLVARQSPLRLTAEVDGVKVMTVDLTLGSSSEPLTAKNIFTHSSQTNRIPQVRNFDDIERTIGINERIAISNVSEKLFRNAARWIGPNRIEGLAALSKLVGMVCPGLHSIFIGFKVSLTKVGPTNDLEFSVLSTDERFRRIKLNITGGGLKGMVEAALRTRPVLQPSLEEIATQVQPGSFSGQRALVIGGSRGIGEYTAKAIAAGGGQVTVTYRVGLAEVKELQGEIRAFGGAAELLAYEVRIPASAQLEKLKVLPTHVYYFATGHIFGRHGNEFSASLYQEFYQFYVAGFYDLCSALRKMTDRFSVFYPSSVAVTPEERPKGMTEYAMAKAAGELLCADMKWLLPGVEVMVKRLPRLPTDQTATNAPLAKGASMDILLPMILEMHR